MNCDILPQENWTRNRQQAGAYFSHLFNTSCFLLVQLQNGSYDAFCELDASSAVQSCHELNIKSHHSSHLKCFCAFPCPCALQGFLVAMMCHQQTQNCKWDDKRSSSSFITQ